MSNIFAVPDGQREYLDALEKVERGEARSVTHVQEQERLKETLKTTETAHDSKIESTRERLAREQADLDKLERARSFEISRWESMLTSRSNLIAALKYGAGQFDTLDEEEGRLAYLREQFGNEYGPHRSVNALIQLGAMIAGLRVVRAEYPGWKATREAQLAQVSARIETFAHEHGIKPR
jgi:hypothetical protein